MLGGRRFIYEIIEAACRLYEIDVGSQIRDEISLCTHQKAWRSSEGVSVLETCGSGNQLT